MEASTVTQDTEKVAEQPHPNSVAAFATLGEFLNEDGWYPKEMHDKTIYQMAFAGKNGQFLCYAQIRMDVQQFIFYVMSPIKVSETNRPAVAEFITRANYGLRIGNFEMDVRDGEVRYKSALDFEGTSLVPALIKHAMYPAVQTMDRYFPGLMGVAYGSKTPEQAITEIENQ